MILKEFIDRFCDGKIDAHIFNSWSTDETTISYDGRIENLTRSPEDYEELLNMIVDSIDVGNDRSLLICLK